jgi:hypothetical protein
MTGPSLATIATVIPGAVGLMTLWCAWARRFLADEPEPAPGEIRLFIPPADLTGMANGSLLRIAPVVVAAETLHRANGHMPTQLGPDTPSNYWPDFVPYPARHRLTTKEDSHR